MSPKSNQVTEKQEKPETQPATATAGGTEFAIQNETAMVEHDAETPGDLAGKIKEEQQQEQEQEQQQSIRHTKHDADLDLALNGIMIETCAKMMGNIAQALTGVGEVNFTEDEIEQLKKLWSPLIPTMSPVAGAIIGTLIIVGGKVAVYSVKKKEHLQGGVNVVKEVENEADSAEK